MEKTNRDSVVCEPMILSSNEPLTRGDNNPVARDNSRVVISGNNAPVILEKRIRGTVVTFSRLKLYAFTERKAKIEYRDIFAREASITNKTHQHQRKAFISDTCKFDIMKTQRGVEAVNIKIEERNINSVSKLPKVTKKEKETDEQQTHIFQLNSSSRQLPNCSVKYLKK